MWRNCLLFVTICGCLCKTSSIGVAQDKAFGLRDETPPTFRAPTPLEDDAQLHDVQFLNANVGWAVGEHGVIWHTTNGGRAWQLQSSGVSEALRSICFLTDQIGWIAGGGTEPFTHQSRGVVLHTTNGGQNWERLTTSGISQVYRVKFFGLKEGVMAGDPGPQSPTGLMFTQDGGRTWTGAVGMKVRGWRAGDFLNSRQGLVCGTMGRIAVVVEGNLNKVLMTNLGLRGIHAVKLAGGDRAWAAGDGGLVLTSNNVGIDWKTPPRPLPEEIRNTFDFRAVEAKGDHVWIAGRPGSVIWHSPDGGQTWQRQPTKQTVPITAISFSSKTDGWAVGALGMMLRTTDGGRTWTPNRGDGRRSAVMTLHTRSDQVSVNLVAQLAGEQGYRSVVSLLPRVDAGPSGDQWGNFDSRLHEAVAKAGGSVGETYWRLPLDVPGLGKNSARLWDDWSRRTENKLPEVILGRLVAELRMWRPSVLVIDQPAPDDAVGQVLLKAVTRAASAAADPTRFSKHRELNDLPPWQVRKIYARLPEGSTGDANINPHEFLPHFRQSVHMAASRAHGRLSADHHRPAVSEAYRLIKDFGETSKDATVSRRGFFADLHLSPGGDARRQWLPIQDDLKLERKIARLQKQSRAYREQFMDDPLKSAQIVAQLNDFINGLTEAEMAIQLAELIAEYRKQGDWELAETVATVLVERFPNEPPAQEAMQWLMQLWSSAETSWRRAQESTTSQQRIRSDPQKVLAQLNRPRLSTQRQRFAQLNPQAQLEVLSNIQTVLEAANPDPRQQKRIHLNQPTLTPRSNRAEFPDGLIQLKSKFRELDHVADDTPQLQLAGGTEKPDQNPVGNALHLQSRAAQVRMAERLEEWHGRATRMAELMSDANPDMFQGPKTQFPLAALMRKRGLPNEADRIYRRFRQRGSDDPWALSGTTEVWFSYPRENPPKAFQACGKTPQRPNLDGVLSDPCWADAAEIPLTNSGPQTESGRDAKPSFAMLSHDADYLYFAASFSRVPETPEDLPTEGRTHDADLSHFDRVTLLLDVDRDYATFYSLTFDQRGWTHDACWEDASWNPKYFVKAHGDKTSWRIEVAIPWSELGPRPPLRNDVWNVGIVRTIPAVGLQSWTHPAAEKPRPEVFGLIRFD